MKPRLWHSAIVCLILTAAAVLPAHAQSLCGASAESGTWIRSSPDNKTLSRIEIKTTCENGQRGWNVRAQVKCGRTHCSWGYAKGVRRPDGALAALFSTFTAERLVRMSADEDDLSVTLVSIFRDVRRGKEISRYVLQRQY